MPCISNTFFFPVVSSLHSLKKASLFPCGTLLRSRSHCPLFRDSILFKSRLLITQTFLIAVNCPLSVPSFNAAIISELREKIMISPFFTSLVALLLINPPVTLAQRHRPWYQDPSPAPPVLVTTDAPVTVQQDGSAPTSPPVVENYYQPSYGSPPPANPWTMRGRTRTAGNGAPSSAADVAPPVNSQTYNQPSSVARVGPPANSQTYNQPSSAVGVGPTANSQTYNQPSSAAGGNPTGNQPISQETGAPTGTGGGSGPGSATGSASAVVPSSTGSSECGPDEIRINWTGDFHFLYQGGFGDAPGQGGAAASACWSTSVTGAAMFICESECNAAGDAAPAKYTKFECTLSSDYPNCDMSLVDGYSLPAQCSFQSSAGYVSIGGLEDLWSTAACPQEGGDNTCNNIDGYSGSINDLSPFFANAQQNGNNYCNWQFCPGLSDPAWDASTRPVIECQVGAGKSKRSLEARNETAQDPLLVAPKDKRLAITEDNSALEARDVDVADNLKGIPRRGRGIHGGAAHIHARNLKNQS